MNATTTNTLTLIGRVLMSLMFITSGWGKIAGYAATQGYMESAGVPGILLPLVILLELGGGIAIALGLATRWIAIALALFTMAAAFLFHGNIADQMQGLLFWKNITIAGGFLILAAVGAGAYSVDAKLLERNAA